VCGWLVVSILLSVVVVTPDGCTYFPLSLSLSRWLRILSVVVVTLPFRVVSSASVVCHKTFHRYVVRAKRGTCQSSRDSKSNSAPKSAGASLRRYNEAALTQVTSVDILSF